MASDKSFTRLKTLCDDGKLDEVFHTLTYASKISFTNLSDIFYRLLQGCIDAKNLTAGRKIYCQIVRHNLEAVSYVGSHLIRMFAACRKLPDANCVFNRLPKPNLFAWNEIIFAHVRLGCAERALKLYNQMQSSSIKPDSHILVTMLKACASIEGLKQGRLIHCNSIEFCAEPGLFVWSALIDMYAKCGSMKDARTVFDRLRRRNAVIWSAMIAGYVKHGHGEEAFRLYAQMPADGFDVDLVMLVSILKACSITRAVHEGKLIHAQIMECGFVMDTALGNSLLDMYARCGSHADTCNVFHLLAKRDFVTWSSMVESYADHRDHGLALSLFELMLKEGLRPDNVACLCLLSACSQLGLVQSGCSHFNTLVEKFGILPRLDHFNCMVDLLGRAGCLIEAEDLLKTMPFYENIVGRRSLLSHCKSYSDVVLVEQCDVQASTLHRKDALSSVTMSGMFANPNCTTDAREREGMRGSMRASSLCGEATIMVEKSVHVFTVEDGVKNFGLLNKLARLSAQMKDEGYSPGLELLFQPVLGEENDFLHS